MTSVHVLDALPALASRWEGQAARLRSTAEAHASRGERHSAAIERASAVILEQCARELRGLLEPAAEEPVPPTQPTGGAA